MRGIKKSTTELRSETCRAPSPAPANMFLISLLITAGIFIGVSLLMLSLTYLLRRFRPSPPLPPKPAANDLKNVLDTIPVVCHIKSEGLFECSVCLLSVEEGEKVRFLPDCGHGFHARCIDEWLCSKLTCPYCRLPVISPAKSLSNVPDALSCWPKRSSARDGDGSNGGGESGTEREESSSV